MEQVIMLFGQITCVRVLRASMRQSFYATGSRGNYIYEPVTRRQSQADMLGLCASPRDLPAKHNQTVGYYHARGGRIIYDLPGKHNDLFMPQLQTA